MMCRLLCSMPTNLAIDESLLDEARKVGNFRTKKETVNSALREFIERRKQLEILQLRGSISYRSDYDHRKLRNRKRKAR